MAHMSSVFHPNLLRTCRYFLKISYIGTKYKGVQRQTRRSEVGESEDGTVQTAIERSLNRALCPVYGSCLAISSRTDAGVHAYMNTANVDLTHPLPETIYKPTFITDATNRILSYSNHEISILETRLIPSYFHSRINAKWRSYVYRLGVIKNLDYSNFPQQMQYQLLRAYLPLSQINRCHIVSSIDIDLVKKSCEILQGQHDFKLFTTRTNENINKKTEKCIDEFRMNTCQPLNNLEIVQSESASRIDFYEFFIKSNSFLYNQVRRMISAVIDVGLGRITLRELENMVNSPFKKSNALSQMVPACGLYLFEIGYNEDDFILYDNFNEYSPKGAYYNEDLFNDTNLEEE